MPKKAGLVFLTAGAVLILSALSLFIYNRNEDSQAGQNAEALLSDVQSHIAASTASAAPEDTLPAETLPPEMPVLEIDGYGYVGYLSIPDLELELPVMAEWDYERLKLAPCRQHGSSRTDDLVIAAHNYSTHFGRLSTLEQGAVVEFTDMDGVKNTYTVDKTEILAPTDVDAVLNSRHDLVLYTCTPGGQTRVGTFCTRTTT